MRILTTLFLSAALITISGCSHAPMSRDNAAGSSQASMPESASISTATESAQRSAGGGSKARAEAQVQNISLDQADASQTVPIAQQRKIIRNATLSIEIDAPADGQRRIASIAEARGGFVVTSESRQQGGASSESKPHEVVTIEVRVPAAEFDAVVSEIRAVGGRVKEEKITGQDVTEEYIDLEARLRTKKALEAQFIEIMKSARKVSDALEVQSEMAEVRTEIERLEGRRRFLENQSSLSTIKITLQPPAPLISANTSGFFHGLRQAFGEGLDVAAAITLGLIRVAIALIPVLLLILLPIVVAVRLLRRRSRRWPFTEKAAPLE
ncbi:MAG: DUF4349 domain-containing protein [Acidobacteriota bacterium]|nr:DUF4349 domain-containing protein [Acidobacteriota bacterium]